MSLKPLSQQLHMGLWSTHAGMKMSYGGAVAPERKKVALLNGTNRVRQQFDRGGVAVPHIVAVRSLTARRADALFLFLMGHSRPRFVLLSGEDPLPAITPLLILLSVIAAELRAVTFLVPVSPLSLEPLITFRA